MTAPTLQQAVQARDQLTGDGSAFAVSLASPLTDAIGKLQGLQTPQPWSSYYLPTATAADKAARFACTQIGVVGSNPALVAQVFAAFGTAALGTPAPIVADVTSATQAKVAARVSAALSLAAQPGAVALSSSWTAASISSWVTSANTAFTTQWAAQPIGGDPTTAPAYVAALAALAAAYTPAANYLSTAQAFQ